MKKISGTVNVGLKDKDTNKVICVYPHPVTENDTDVEKKVRDWFYQQSCGAEDEMRNYYVDVIEGI